MLQNEPSGSDNLLPHLLSQTHVGLASMECRTDTRTIVHVVETPLRSSNLKDAAISEIVMKSDFFRWGGMMKRRNRGRVQWQRSGKLALEVRGGVKSQAIPRQFQWHYHVACMFHKRLKTGMSSAGGARGKWQMETRVVITCRLPFAPCPLPLATCLPSLATCPLPLALSVPCPWWCASLRR